MRGFVLPVSLALAAVAAGNLPAEERPSGSPTFLPLPGPTLSPATPTAPPAKPATATPSAPAATWAPASGAATPHVEDVTPALPPLPAAEGHDAGPAPPFLATTTPAPAGAGLSAFADVLIWRARWQNMDYAIIDPRVDLAPQGTVQSVNPPTRAGLRIGAAYALPGSAWTAAFTYTYFRTEGSQSLIAPAGGNLFPTLTRPGLIDTVTSATGQARLILNVYDFDLGRDFCVDPTFTLRFLGGVRFASVHEALNARYDGGDAVGAQVSTSSNFSGAGPTVGGQGTWALGSGFSLFGRARTSLLYGSVRSRIRETDRNGQVLHNDVADGVSRAVPVLDLGLGVNYQYQHFFVSAGYEISHWFQVADSSQFVNDFAPAKFITRQSSLTLDGVYIRAGVTY